MAQELLDYARAPTAGTRWIRPLYKHSYAFVGAMMLFLNLFPGGTRGPYLGSGFTSELGWPIAHHREIFTGRAVIVDYHREFLAVDAVIVLFLAVLFAIASRWYLRQLQFGQPKSIFLAVPIAQGLFALFLVFVCLSHLLFNLRI